MWLLAADRIGDMVDVDTPDGTAIQIGIVNTIHSKSAAQHRASVCERFQVLDKIPLTSPRVLGARMWALAHVQRGERTRFDRRSRKGVRLFVGRTSISPSFFSVADGASSL